MSMTGPELSAALKSLGIRQRHFAALLSEPGGAPVSEQTVSRWCADPQRRRDTLAVPGAVAFTVRLLLHLQGLGFDPVRVAEMAKSPGIKSP